MELGSINQYVRHPEVLMPDKSKPADQPRQTKVDSVDISLESRRKLATLADSQREDNDKLVKNRDRVDLIRQRIENGYYDRPDVRSSIADRLIGDI